MHPFIVPLFLRHLRSVCWPICRLKHRHFLRPAAERRAVKHAMRFVQLLPRRYADSRTYNMLVSVCAAARDVNAALHAADMMKRTGRKLDTILYTNLITGRRAVWKLEPRAIETTCRQA